MISVPPIAITAAASGNTTTQPISMAITQTKTPMNSTSTNITTVCEVKKSRSTSYCEMRLTKAPVEAGRDDTEAFITLSNSTEESRKSICRPAWSMMAPRAILSRKSKTNTIKRPIASTQSVEIALLGNTRS